MPCGAAMVAARGADESTEWRQPIDLAALCDEAEGQLSELFAARSGASRWSGHTTLSQELLGDDPANIIDALKAAILAGAAPSDLGRSLAYGTALRVARFGNANEHADWETAHHVFTYANALHRLLERIGPSVADRNVSAIRGLLHGAMALYLTRYLNVPPARIPGEDGERLDDLPTNQESIRDALLDAFDRQQQVDLAARLVARHLASNCRRGSRRSRARCFGKTRASMLTRYWRRGSGNSLSGATPTTAGASSSQSPAISPHIRRRSARRCRWPASPGADARRGAVSGSGGVVQRATAEVMPARDWRPS